MSNKAKSFFQKHSRSDNDTGKKGIIKGQGELLLVVDDEENILDVMKEMLEHMGYHVALAKSGREAIDTVKRTNKKISLILLDVVMPDMDGRATYSILKTLDPELKVLVISGYPAENCPADILQAGCEGFLQKPFGLVELSRKIRAAMETKRAG
ncbi:MAG TPA: response regulator [Syntrophales bacterium]|nr:response regulator [Syntrophales bacterium]